MKRAIPSAVLAVFITLGLILTMYGLIKMDEPELENRKSIKLPDFVHADKNEDLQTIAPKPDRPDDIQDQPDVPEVDVTPNQVDIDSNLSLGAVRVGINRDLKGFNSNDGEYLPIFRAPPVYPRRAAERGMCGWVELTYTVTASGGTRDPKVTASSSSMFEKAAIKAALKYKYKARQVGGKPVDVPDVPIRIVFEMEGKEGCADDR
ncbi:MAG: TonB family protein [Gammaproteobacteria bacterium]|nr:TonB family protein [Gammaproteobacteria bacterium]